jgi:DNA polymerase-4
MDPPAFAEPILHVDMDAFFVEVERLRHPDLRGRPVAVGGGGSRGVVASASYEARRLGVTSAMPTSMARKACPQLVVVPSDHDEYGRVSEAVFAVFRSVTPLVEGLSMDEAFLDVSGMRRHYPEPGAIAREVRQRIRTELGLPASVGNASTKFVAKLASAAAKPDGIRLIRAEETLAFLHALPARALFGVGQATHAALEGLGIETVGDLARIPEHILRRRLGYSVGGHLAALAAGHDPRRVVPDREAKSISVSETYERDLVVREEISTEILRLCERLGSRMRRAGLAGRTVGLTVRYSNFETITRQATRATATDSAHVLWKALSSLAAKVDWDRPVRLLGVSCASLMDPAEVDQLSIDGPNPWEDLTDTVEAVRDRFGRSSIGLARLLAGLAGRKEIRSERDHRLGSD